jgi:hypothetical protein
MPQSIYTRGKNEQGKWRYSRIETGKGRKTSQLEPPSRDRTYPRCPKPSGLRDSDSPPEFA